MSDLRIAIAGLGAIGRALARRLADGVPGLTLACAAARDEEAARGWLDERGHRLPDRRAGGISRSMPTSRSNARRPG